MENRIFFTKFGSHVYGTNVPESDHDFKGIFLPSAKEILLQRATKTSINQNSNPDPNAKNTASDTDVELFSIQGFLRLCAEGQTAALDMLFAPKKHWEQTSPEWEFIIKHRNKLTHKGVSAFVGYCQSQAAKYGIKGSRIASVRTALDFLSILPPHDRLKDQWPAIEAFVKKHQSDKYSSISKDGKKVSFIEIVEKQNPAGVIEKFFGVNNRKLGQHIFVKYAMEVLQRIFDEYGHRAMKAEKNEGIDWKALMHAVRVCEEAKELLSTGFITFPRPEKDLLLKIRKAELPYKEVAALIEEGVQDIDDYQSKSSLPTSIDNKFWETWLLDVHSKVVISSVSINPTLSLNLTL